MVLREHTLAGFMLTAVAAGVLAVGSIVSPASASADEASVKVFKYTNRSGVTSFSDRAPMNRRYQVIEVDLNCYACNLQSSVDWHNTPLNLDDFQGTIISAANQYDVDPALVRAVIHAESAFRPNVKSRAGALGLMQLMPGTAKDMGVSDPLSPEQNIRGGVRYLAWLLEQTKGNTTLATAAYNAGPGAVARHNGIPPYEETQTYVKRVRILHDRYRKALTQSS
jgi:soluble lytic murein transglycosylase-like protein